MDRLRAEAQAGFPENVTAFREEMAVHGRYGQPCPRRGEKIQRIRYADILAALEGFELFGHARPDHNIQGFGGNTEVGERLRFHP
jgi:hypothetical protein